LENPRLNGWQAGGFLTFATAGFVILWTMQASAAPGLAEAERRASALIATMTLEEKAGQLSQQFVFAWEKAFEQPIREGRIGSVIYINDPAMINRLQRIAVEQSRLKIPLLVAHENGWLVP
jgi:hypothetical protein